MQMQSGGTQCTPRAPSRANERFHFRREHRVNANGRLSMRCDGVPRRRKGPLSFGRSAGSPRRHVRDEFTLPSPGARL